jgi:hypothetical protein
MKPIVNALHIFLSPQLSVIDTSARQCISRTILQTFRQPLTRSRRLSFGACPPPTAPVRRRSRRQMPLSCPSALRGLPRLPSNAGAASAGSGLRAPFYRRRQQFVVVDSGSISYGRRQLIAGIAVDSLGPTISVRPTGSRRARDRRLTTQSERQLNLVAAK